MYVTVMRDGQHLDVIATNGTDPSAGGYIQQQIRVTLPPDQGNFRVSIDDTTLVVEEVAFA